MAVGVNRAYVPSADRCRMPNAEWEYAARAGTNSTYWRGDSIEPACANYLESPGFGTLPVHSFDPNPWELYNVLENVDEWVGGVCTPSFLDVTPVNARSRQTGNNRSTDFRVTRCGNWRSDAEAMRSCQRGCKESNASDSKTGFRLVREVPVGKH